MLAAAAVAAFASCAKELDNPEETTGKMKTITVQTDIVTKTTLDSNHANLIWSEGDKISIFNDQDNTNLEKVYEAGKDLTITVPEATTEIYAHYPWYGGNTAGPTKVSVRVPSNQTQTNPGELNGYYYPMVAKGKVTGNKAIISLYPVASALALNLYHSDLSGEETVTSVTVTPSASNSGASGSQETNITLNNVVYSQGASSSSITVTLTNPLTLGSTKPANKQTFNGQIYICLAKQSYKNLKFEIETSKGKYTITSSNTTPFNCVDNDFVPVTLDLAKATFKENRPATEFEWSLVTSADQIVAGAEVVIVSKDAAFAMSQTQNSNNRGQVAIAKTGSKISWEENAKVQTFEIVNGSVENTIAFKCADGDQKGNYIYAASSSNNYLKTQNSINGNASWTVEIDDSNVATLKAQGGNTRNLLRYNSNSSCFSCYASGQGAVVLYIKGEVADPDAKAIISNGTISVAATGAAADYEGAYSLQNIDEDTEEISLTASENIIEPFALGGDVTFSMAPNYTTNKVTGNISLTLDSDESVNAVIPVEQKASSLKVSTTEVIIPANATEISFTVTSPEFGWVITSEDDGIQFTESGAASESPTTVTVSSGIAATSQQEDIAVLTISRKENDPQAKTVYVKKAATGGESALYSATFEGDDAHRTSGSNSYTASPNEYTDTGVTWSLVYADAVTSGTPLSGSANVFSRIAKNTTNSPTAITSNVLSQSATITKITFLSKLGSNVSLALQYSTDGTHWTTATVSKDTDVHSNYGYSAELTNVTTSTLLLKFVWSVASSTTGNRDSQLDNVTVYGR